MRQADRRGWLGGLDTSCLPAVALATAVGLIGWHFRNGGDEVLTPDGGPVATVMDFGQSFPLDPLPSGWRHRKFWTRSP